MSNSVTSEIWYLHMIWICHDKFSESSVIWNSVSLIMRYIICSASIWYFIALLRFFLMLFHCLWDCLSWTILHDTFKIDTFFSDFTESAFDVFSATAERRLSRRNCAVIVNLQTFSKYWIIYSYLYFFLLVIDCSLFFKFNCQNKLIRVLSASFVSLFVICIILLILKFFFVMTVVPQSDSTMINSAVSDADWHVYHLQRFTIIVIVIVFISDQHHYCRCCEKICSDCLWVYHSFVRSAYLNRLTVFVIYIAQISEISVIIIVFVKLNVIIHVHFFSVTVIKTFKVLSAQHFCAVSAQKIICYVNIVWFSHGDSADV